MGDESRGDDPAVLLAMVEHERERTIRAIEPDARLIYGLWGIAWLIGFLLMWLARRDDPSLDGTVAGIAYAALMIAAIVVTIVHTMRRTAGVRGVSSRVGAMYGWCWFLGFAGLTAVMNAALRAGASDELIGILWPALSGLVVGLLYLAGGALWQDRFQYGLGLWILISSSIGALAGYPGVYLVMALCGGGGFLLAAAFFTVRRTRIGA
jgi:hypothetical protein